MRYVILATLAMKKKPNLRKGTVHMLDPLPLYFSTANVLYEYCGIVYAVLFVWEGRGGAFCHLPMPKQNLPCMYYSIT